MSFILSLLSIGPMSILINDHIAMLNLGVKGPRSASKVKSSIFYHGTRSSICLDLYDAMNTAKIGNLKIQLHFGIEVFIFS